MTDTEKPQVRIRPNIENYQTGISGSGSKTMNNGDPVAVALDGLTLDEVKTVASNLGFEDVEKYANLNVGQQRMNLGNRIRGIVSRMDKAYGAAQVVLEKEDATPEETKAAKAVKSNGIDALGKAAAAGRKACEGRLKAAAKAKEDKLKEKAAAKEAEKKAAAEKQKEPAAA